jgi:hypothetical protein
MNDHTSRTDVQQPCKACATVRPNEDWQALPLVTSIYAADLVPAMLTRWSGRVIEVRRCASCGRGVARVAPRRVTP